jgi:hypothetical protein
MVLTVVPAALFQAVGSWLPPVRVVMLSYPVALLKVAVLLLVVRAPPVSTLYLVADCAVCPALSFPPPPTPYPIA